MKVPVVDQNQRPLMPTTCSRARRWIKSGKATPKRERDWDWVFDSSPSPAPYALREAFTVKSQSHTYLNIQTHAVDWVKDAFVTLSTKAGHYREELRDLLGLKKSKNKLADKFSAHCVDSWVLANWYVGGHNQPDNTKLLLVISWQFHRRQLHRLQHAAPHERARYGGTISAGFKRGSIVKYPKYGLCYIGGFMHSPNKKQPNRQVVSLHCLKKGLRLTQNANPTDLRFLTYNSWRTLACC